MHDFLIRLKFVKAEDVISAFVMLIASVLAPFYRLYRKHLWLIMERRGEARDNGYWFFKYLREKHPEIDAVYVIDPVSADYNRVAVLGKTIRPRTLKHWIYYFSAQYNISSQKDGNPNAAVCFVLENYLMMNNHRIFLQHGIIYNDLKWLYYKVSNFEMFACSTEREYDYIKAKFGFPADVVRLVGLTRYDNLLTQHNIKRQILVMPTWREWLDRISSDTIKFETSDKFTDSEYFKVWSSFLNNADLVKILEVNNCQLIFYPHSNLQKYIADFDVPKTDKIVLADSEHYDVQQLLMESAALITDYSSVFFDFAYMDKPLAYYQFDYEKFRKGQYQKGYFSYESDGFGPVVSSEDDAVAWVEKIVGKNFVNAAGYTQRVNDFFTLRDTYNCERTYNAICNLIR